MRDDDAVVDQATEVMTVEERPDNSTTNNESGSRNHRKSKKGAGRQKNNKNQQTKAEPVVLDDPTQVIKSRFAACGRCCYFLGGYTSAHGEGELETAVQNNLSDWLTLTWDQQTRNLVHKAFGVQLDVDYYFYEGCCVACYRQFSLRTDETEGPIFQVQL